ncbi:hypothetical protein ES703_40961 [subsurface metagenome]
MLQGMVGKSCTGDPHNISLRNEVISLGLGKISFLWVLLDYPKLSGMLTKQWYKGKVSDDSYPLAFPLFSNKVPGVKILAPFHINFQERVDRCHADSCLKYAFRVCHAG